MSFMKILASCAAGLTMAFSAASAQAAPVLHFNYSCLTISLDCTGISFDLPESPDVSAFDPEAFDINGVLSSLGVQDLSFFIADIDGGFSVQGLTMATGPQLFTGPTSNPVFITGTFETACSLQCRSTLVISRINAVPEPASLGLFGMALLSVAATRRKSRGTPTA